MNFKLALAAASLAMSGLAHSATIDWTTWSNGSGTVTGTAGSVGVTYTGAGYYAGDVPDWSATPASWVGGDVANLPTTSNGIIHLTGGDEAVATVTFSQAVTNPVIAIWSLGQGGVGGQFVFGQTPVIEAGGPNYPYGGSTITLDGDTVTGFEGNGTVEFLGTFTSLSFTNPVYENWYGFTVGVSAVPEPATLGLMLAGLTLVGLARRRASK